MFELIVRFRNEDDIKALADRLGIKISKYISEIELPYEKLEYIRYQEPTYLESERDIGYVGMPEFNRNFKLAEYHKITFKLDTEYFSIKRICLAFNQNITEKTKSIWYPKWNPEIDSNKNLRVLGGEMPIHPMYIVSKNRAVKNYWHTSWRLAQIGIPHYIVVEPQEVEAYRETFDHGYATILELDMKFKEDYDVIDKTLGNVNSTGPGAARNFVWEHSKANGDKWHWVFDDNIDGFCMYWRGHRIKCFAPGMFRAVEKFVDRYDNIGQAGLNYASFMPDGTTTKAITINTRIYSLILNRNDVQYRWRGRYNEDTILSLDIITSGLCTVQFNGLVGEKLTTQKVGGGNTTEFYEIDEEGTRPKSQMLVDVYPQYATLVHRFNRVHHYVNYTQFKEPLKLKEGISLDDFDDIDNQGIEIYRIPWDICGNRELDNAKWLSEHVNEFERVDNTDLFL